MNYLILSLLVLLLTLWNVFDIWLVSMSTLKHHLVEIATMSVLLWYSAIVHS